MWKKNYSQKKVPKPYIPNRKFSKLTPYCDDVITLLVMQTGLEWEGRAEVMSVPVDLWCPAKGFVVYFSPDDDTEINPIFMRNGIVSVNFNFNIEHLLKDVKSTEGWNNRREKLGKLFMFDGHYEYEGKSFNYQDTKKLFVKLGKEFPSNPSN